MFEAAVEVGIAAFLRGDRPPSDAEVAKTLERQGVESWLIRRLVVFLPLAFGRRLLDGVRVAPNYTDGDASWPLDGDPVYRAIAARAEHAGGGEIDRIGLRSSEVDAVNQLLNRGSKLAGLVLTETRLARPLPPLGDGEGGVRSPREAFAELLREHGTAAGSFEFDAALRPNPSTGVPSAQVDFLVRHPGLAAGQIVESFAGLANTWQDAIGLSIARFALGSLHPILAVLADRTAAADQVEWERIDHPTGPYDLCLGPQLFLYADDGPPIRPVLDALIAALPNVPLTRAIHSLRVFTLHHERELRTVEVLLDNQPWTTGQSVVASTIATPTTSQALGIRLFALLSPPRHPTHNTPLPHPAKSHQNPGTAPR
jgi:hypothetical protein